MSVSGYCEPVDHEHQRKSEIYLLRRNWPCMHQSSLGIWIVSRNRNLLSTPRSSLIDTRPYDTLCSIQFARNQKSIFTLWIEARITKLTHFRRFLISESRLLQRWSAKLLWEQMVSDLVTVALTLTFTLTFRTKLDFWILCYFDVNHRLQSLCDSNR